MMKKIRINMEKEFMLQINLKMIMVKIVSHKKPPQNNQINLTRDKGLNKKE
jgi:hypothetical protein